MRTRKEKKHTAAHAANRSSARIGIELSEVEIRQLTNRVLKGEFGEPVYVQSRTLSWYRITINSIPVYALYQKRLTIVTFYPESMWADYVSRMADKGIHVPAWR